MYSYATIEAQVKANINSTTENVQQEIDDAVAFLSNFFSNTAIDASQSTAVGTATLNLPTGSLEIERVKIGTVEHEKINLNKLSTAEDSEDESFYEYNGKIQLVPTPTAITTAQIWYRKAFTAMAGAGNTDIPNQLVPILIHFASAFAWEQIATKVETARENYPDMTPNEARTKSRMWLDYAFKMIAKVQQQHA